MFAELVRPAKDRPVQSQAVVDARANHRLCYVFENPIDYLAATLEIHYPHERN